MSSAADRLAKLTKLHDEGVITDDEYEAKRAELIDEMLTDAPQLSVSTEKWSSKDRAAVAGAGAVRSSGSGGSQKRKLTTIQKVAIGAAIVIGISVVVASGQLGDLSNDDGSGTFETISESLTGSGQVAADKSLSGTGEEATAPFRLGGDYQVSMSASNDCYYSFRLVEAATGNTAERLGSLSDVGSTSTRIYNLPTGSYYLDVNTGPSPSCPWRINISG